MKYLLLLTSLFVTFIANSQSIAIRSIYSTELKDTIKYRVWLPENFDKNEPHPAIYTVEDTEDGIVFGCASFGMQTSSVPPNTIVFGIIKGRTYIDYDFSTGKPNHKGDVFLKELKTQIIPNVEKEFGYSKYKAFMGHSYSAAYGVYLMLQQPQLFKGYILFAPERWWIDETKPVFDIPDSTKTYYSQNTAFVYLSVGENDIERRKQYVKEISEKVKIMDSITFHFNSSIATGANHMNVVPQKMDAALWRIFYPFHDFEVKDSVENVLTYFNEVQRKINTILGIEIPKDVRTSWKFYALAAKNKDEKAVEVFMNFFPFQQFPGSTGVDYCNIAYVFEKNKWNEKAKEFYLKAIDVSINELKEKPIPQNKANIVWASRDLAFKVYDSKEQGWDILSDAIRNTQLLSSYVNIGRFAIEKKYNIKEVVQYLEKAIEMKDDEDFVGLQAKILQYLADGYLLIGNKQKAAYYTKQATTIKK